MITIQSIWTVTSWINSWTLFFQLSVQWLPKVAEQVTRIVLFQEFFFFFQDKKKKKWSRLIQKPTERWWKVHLLAKYASCIIEWITTRKQLNVSEHEGNRVCHCDSPTGLSRTSTAKCSDGRQNIPSSEPWRFLHFAAFACFARVARPGFYCNLSEQPNRWRSKQFLSHSMICLIQMRLDSIRLDQIRLDSTSSIHPDGGTHLIFETEKRVSIIFAMKPRWLENNFFHFPSYFFCTRWYFARRRRRRRASVCSTKCSSPVSV